jgi:peptidoglycan/xylan/chitin deacetylase (PgdA/CDA1 family)
MRRVIAFIVYLLFLPRVRRESGRRDVLLAIYGHDQRRKPFERLVRWLLRRGYRFVPQEELLEYVSGRKAPDGKLVWLSFDDGWESNYSEVFPVLKKYGIPATIFVSTKGIADGHYWFTRAFQNRGSKLYHAVDDLWVMDNRERVKIIGQLPPYQGGCQTMNEAEIREMTASGLVRWGNHTHDHVMCDRCTEEELVEEIGTCGRIMKGITGEDGGFIFSYPNGNYDGRTVDILKRMGFSMAVTTHIGRVACPSDAYTIPRNEIKNGCLRENILQAFGIWTEFFNIIKGMLKIKERK